MNYDIRPKYLLPGHEVVKCTLLDHAVCISKLLKLFEYRNCTHIDTFQGDLCQYHNIMYQKSDCGCIHPCSTQKALGQMVQYGNYKNAKSIIAHSGQPVETMSAGVIYLSEVVETTHEGKNKKARPRFELGISSLLVRRFNQLSHRAVVPHSII